MANKFLPLIRIAFGEVSRVHLVDREQLFVGRSSESDILLSSASISRKHLSLTVNGSAVFAEDLGSSNGSFINGEKMQPGQKYPIQSDTQLKLGTAGETLMLQLIERPIEFDNYKGLLSKFTRDLESELEKMIVETRGKIDLENSAQAEKMRKATQDLNQIKVNAQSEADKILSLAHQEVLKIKEEAGLQYNKAIQDSQLRSKQIMTDAEAQVELILQEARGAATSTREQAQKESEETMLRTRELGAQLVKKAETDTADLWQQTQSKVQGLEAQVKLKEMLIEESVSLQNEIAALKSDKSRQIELNAQMAAAEKALLDFEKKKSQLHEENLLAQDQLEKMKSRVLSEFENLRRAEENKVHQVVSSKAKEFSQKIEQSILSQLSQMLSEPLKPEQMTSLSQKVSNELNDIFASESFQSVVLTVPSSKRNQWLGYSAAVAALAGIIYAYQRAPEKVEAQSQIMSSIVEQQKDDAKYKPDMTTDFKGSYTENILMMADYLEMKLNPAIQDQWALELNGFFLKKLKLTEEDMVRFMGLEAAMIKKLVVLRDAIDARHLDEGLARMHTAEKEELQKIQAVLKSKKNYLKLRVREKSFLANVSAVRTRTSTEIK